MRGRIIPSLPMLSADDQIDPGFSQRWLPDQYPALHMSSEKLEALRRRERLREDLLEFLGDDITDMVLAVIEEKTHNGRS